MTTTWQALKNEGLLVEIELLGFEAQRLRAMGTEQSLLRAQMIELDVELKTLRCGQRLEASNSPSLLLTPTEYPRSSLSEHHAAAN